MRVAVFIAPWDSTSPQAQAWSQGVAELGAALAGIGFRVAVIGATHNVAGELQHVLEHVSPQDTVLIHVSGRLARRGVLRIVGNQWMPLRPLGLALAGHGASDVSIIAELLHEDDASDALAAADHVATAVSALGVRERGFGVIAAVRPMTAAVEGPAYTRMFLQAATSGSGPAGFSAVFERVQAMPESAAAAQSVTLVRGRTDLEIVGAPVSPDALDAQVEAAHQAQDWTREVELRRQRAATGAPRQRVKELIAIARILQQELWEPESAIAALEEARTLEPHRTSVLQALKRGYELTGRWASAAEATAALIEATPTPAERAALRFAQARMTIDHLQDPGQAVNLLELALQEDPSLIEARATLAQLRSSVMPPDPMPIVQPGAALENGYAAISTQPPPPLPVAIPAQEEPEEAEVIAEAPAPPSPRRDELDPETHLRAFARQMRDGHTDAAYLSAMALEELQTDDVDAQILIDQFRSVAPIRARGMLDEAGWALLRPFGMDEVLAAVFGTIARAGALARIEQLKERERLVVFDPATKLDEGSTASVVRSFQWAARMLGVQCPGLYVLPEVPGEISAVRAPEPSTAVGPSVVSGRSAKDLAFLAGRHLTYYRPEHAVVVYFPTHEELTRLLLAAVALTKGSVPETGEGARAVATLTARLDRHINDGERASLRRAIATLHQRGGKFSISAWTRNVELTAARAGLLLSGDLATAMTIVNAETRDIAGLTLEAKRRDLVGFCASDEHAMLRSRFAVAAPSSIRPPAPAAEAAYS